MAQSTAQSPEKAFERFFLPNGLEVIVIENHFVPIATLELAVRNGSFTEGPEYAGLSHLYEHMFFKANGEYESSQDFIAKLSSLGALYNATTREEVVYYYYTLPAVNLGEGIEIMSNTVQTPHFDSVELERERARGEVVGLFPQRQRGRAGACCDCEARGDEFEKRFVARLRGLARKLLGKRQREALLARGWCGGKVVERAREALDVEPGEA